MSNQTNNKGPSSSSTARGLRFAWRPARKHRECLVTLVALFAMLTLAPAASANLTFGTFGAGAGQTEHPSGIAVDDATEELYVADRSNYRVDVFAADGEFIFAFGWGVADGISHELQTCTIVCYPGIAGGGAGQLSGPESIAIDNNPASPSYNDVYVSGNSPRVQKFTPTGEFIWVVGGHVDETTGANLCTNASKDLCGEGRKGKEEGEFGEDLDPMAPGPNGSVDVVDCQERSEPGAICHSRVTRFSSSGEAIAQIALLPVNSLANSFAETPTGEFYTTDDQQFVRKFSAGGTELLTLVGGANGIALNSAGDVFVGRQDTGKYFPSIAEFSSNGQELASFGYDLSGYAIGLAQGPAGETYAVLGDGEITEVEPPVPGPVIMPTTPPGSNTHEAATQASEIGNTKATLNAYVNPEGEATKVHFEIVDQHDYETEGGFASPHTQSTEEVTLPESGFSMLHAAARVTTGLTPDTVYRIRAVAVNADGETLGPEASFETQPPLQIDETWTTGVTADAATLGASVNPFGIPATGSFQYVDDASYKASGFAGATEVPAVASGSAPIAFGTGETPIEATVQIRSLTPGTTYHYRMVAADPFVTVDGPEQILRTSVAYPPANERCSNQAFRVGASAVLPDCRAYEMVSPVEKNNTDIVSLINVNSNPVALDQSTPQGEKLTYTTSQGFGNAQGVPYVSQYIASRGANGWESNDITPPQGVSGIEIGHRIDLEFRDFTSDLCSSVLLNGMTPLLVPGAAEGYLNLYRRQNCGEGGYEALTTASPSASVDPSLYEPDVQGMSADGSCVVFRAEAKLTPEAGSGALLHLYESCDGQLRLVSVLPNGRSSTSPASTGTPNQGLAPRNGTVAGAVSADGSRIYWTATKETPGELYLRENASQEQSALQSGKCSEPTKACTILVASGKAHFWAASSDGSKALYTAETGAGGAQALYEFSVEGDSGTSTQIAGKVLGVLGAGEDATRMYFVSEEVLAGEDTQGKTPTAGDPNLYLFDSTREGAGRYRFIGTLSQQDAKGNDYSPVSQQPDAHTSRVSASGERAVFMSTAMLTSYYNRDAVNGEADAEIYIYDEAADNGDGALSCVSCAPTGQRPTGENLPLEGFLTGTWAAALLSPYETELYGPRVLTENGRVFFDSFEALVPRDTNGRPDVYEWEPPGVGDCTEASPVYSPLNDGCVDLISSGESPTASEFVDASASGDDVFFTTASSLVPQDPGLIDIYDARVEGGFPAPPSQPASCEGEACQSGPSPPHDSTPASATFSGPGDASAPAATPKASGGAKHETALQIRKKKLAKALKACRSKPRAKRKSCEALARKRYGVSTKKRTPAKAKGKGRS